MDAIISDIQEGKSLSEHTVVDLLTKITEVLYDEPNLLELQSPITICGDIHGQLYDLFELFDVALSGQDFSERKFLFMGDYVDRGRYSMETFAYLIALKLKYPNNFFLLRGNHESRAISQQYGFYLQCVYLYGHTGIWSLCNEVFDLLPMAAVVDGKLFAVHGGLSPELPLIECLSLLDRQKELDVTGALSDLSWSDPEETCESWCKNSRGAGYLFGSKPVEQFCHLNRLDLITRSHQLAMHGYQWYFDQHLCTVWSAPNYTYKAGNEASVMVYSGPGAFELKIFGPRDESKRKIPEETPPPAYFL